MRLSTVTAALAFLAIPAIASAHGGNTDPNMVHACIGNGSKIVRVVGASGSCISAPPILAETPAHWPLVAGTGAQGPKGDKGNQGIPGIQGPQGNPGANGTNGANGINGTSATFVDYFSGTTHGGAATGCPNGGAVYAAGHPAVNAYVCNGTNGTNGTNGINGAGGTRAAGPCFNNTNRYVDCGNGTVTDTVTGLIWLKQSDCLANNDWAAANVAAAGLKAGDCATLTDNSSPGDWRLPTRDEWSATITHAVALGCAFSGTPPSVTNDAGTGCLSGGGSSFTGVTSGNYWSSTANETNPRAAFPENLGDGNVGGYVKADTLRVWPVRGGLQ